MPTVRIRVGAALDSNLASVFVPLVSAARRARDQITREMAAAAAGVQGPYRTSGHVAGDALEGIGRAAKRTSVSIGTLADGADQKFAQLARGLRRLPPELSTIAREAERALAAIERTKAREALGLSSPRSPKGQPPGTPGVSGRNVVAGTATALGFGTRFAADVARGAGVELDLSAHVGRATDVDKRAVDLANAGYMPAGTGANARRQDPRALAAEVTKTATETAFDPQKAMEGLQGFVAKTGDLETGRAVFKDLAVLSKATGTELEHMVDAAGDVAAQFDGLPDKAEKTKQVMQAMAGQGKLGAVEIKHLAVQMAGLAAAAPQFEGDTARNMALMGALAQEAKQRGGAKSAAQAVTSVQAFATTFGKNARYTEFNKAGIDVFAKDESGKRTGKIRDPQQIIVEALQKTGADPLKMNKLFMDVRARSAVRGFEILYGQTHANTKGDEATRQAAATKAVNDEFDRLTRAAMGAGETAESFALAMGTSSAQATVFNAKLTSAATELSTSVTPALVALTPAIISATKAFAGAISTILGVKEQRDQQEAQANTSDASNALSVVMAKKAAGMDITEEDKVALGAAFAKLQGQEAKQEREYGQTTVLQDLDIAGDSIAKLFGDKTPSRTKDDIVNEQSRALKLTHQSMNEVRDLLQLIKDGKMRVHVESSSVPTPGAAQATSPPAKIDQSSRSAPK